MSFFLMKVQSEIQDTKMQIRIISKVQSLTKMQSSEFILIIL